jgi:hypothetical protein
MNEKINYNSEILNNGINSPNKYHENYNNKDNYSQYQYQYRNRNNNQYYFYKVLYIITTAIISFLGILIIIDYDKDYNIIDKDMNNNKDTNNKNSNNNIQLQKFYFLYMFSFSFSWLFVLIISFLIVIIIKLNEKIDKNIKTKVNNNISDNDPNNVRNEIISEFYPTANENSEQIIIEKNNVINNNNNNNQILNLKNIYGHEFSNYFNSDSKKNPNLNINLDYSNKQYINDSKNINKNFQTKENKEENILSYYFDFEKIQIIFFSLSFFVYFILAVIGFIIIYQLFSKKIFKNYNAFYKIYLFVFLSTGKSFFFIICFFLKIFFNLNSTSKKNVEFSNKYFEQIELEVKKANRISKIFNFDSNENQDNKDEKKFNINSEEKYQRDINHNLNNEIISYDNFDN